MGVLARKLGIRALSMEDPSQPLLPPSALFESLGLGRSDAGVLINEKQAVRITTVFGCWRVISQDLSRCSLDIFQTLPDESVRVAKEHKYYSLLHDRPNPNMSSMVWRSAMLVSVCSHGNGYSFIKRDGHAKAFELHVLDPGKTAPVRLGGRLMYATTQTTTGAVEYVDPWNMLHFKGLSTDGIVGLSPIQTCKNAFGLTLAAEKFGAQFFGNGARATGVFSHPGSLEAEAYENLKKSVREIMTGENALRPLILEEGMTWHQMSIPPEDAQFLATRKFQKEEIACLYRVPMHLLQDLTRCLPGDAEVFTEEGPRPLREIRPGDFIWSYEKESGRIVRSEVSRLWVNGFDKILTIKTTNRTLRCNAKHKVLARVRVLAPSLAAVGGFRGEDGNLYKLSWKNDWVEAGELEAGDAIISLKALPESGTTDVLPSGRKATVGFMEFCGLLLADGNVFKNKGRPGGVNISRASTALYMDHYRDVMRKEFHRTEFTEQERSTKFRSVALAVELDLLGLSGTALTKRVPGWVYLLPAELRLAFLRGFLDGDGTVDKHGRIVYRIINQEMLSGLRHLCAGLGIPVTNVQKINNRRTAYIRNRKVTGKHDLYSFTCSDPGANRRIGSNDPRYIERFASGKPFGRKGRAYPRFGGKDFDNSELELSRIVSVNCSEIEQEVFDLEVKDTHTFISELVVVRNSTNNNIEHQGLDYVRFCLAPLAVDMESEINYKLLGNGFFSEHNFFDLERGDFASQTTGLLALRNGGVYSTNDVLRALRQNPIAAADGGDIRIIQGANIPLTALVGMENAPKKSGGGTDSNLGDPSSDWKGRRILAGYLTLFRDAVGKVVNRHGPHDEQFVYRTFYSSVLSMAQVIMAMRFGNSELTRRETELVSAELSEIVRESSSWEKDNVSAIAVRVSERIYETLAKEIMS
jgi:HK97 family phage portal protein